MKKVTNDEFIETIESIFINQFKFDKTIYVKRNDPVIITCKEHGDFETKPSILYLGSGCPSCSKKPRLSLEDRINRGKIIHSNKYDYSLISEWKGTMIKYPIICPEHGVWDITWDNHEIKKVGCPKCNKSKGEREVEIYLKNNHIKYETQYKFNGCINPKTGYDLRFDFYIPKYNIAIEYDGEFHFKSVKHFGGDVGLKNIIYLDKLKNEFCNENNIRLIRIPYTDIKNINQILKDNIIDYEDPNLITIRDFLTNNSIKFKQKDNIFSINNNSVEIRYVDSSEYKTDYSRRFGIKGINKKYFINISKENEGKNIRTIWVKDFEINHIRKWDVLKSYIRSSCGIINNRIYARDCEVKEISNKLLRPFLDANSFYGYRSSSLNLGLFLKKDKGELKKGDLVMCYTFGNAFFSKGKYDLEVIRASTLLNTQVIGGASKLIKTLYRNYQTININNKQIEVNSLLFYVDADHNSGNSLSKIGFKFVEWKEPGFMNVDSITKQAYQRQPMKHKEIMERIGKGEMWEVANAGVKTYVTDRKTIIGK